MSADTKDKQDVVKPLSVRVEEEITKGLNEWSKAHLNEETISKFIDTKMQQAQEKVVLKLLGFDHRWSDRGWELDHCNGRSGNSAAGDTLRAMIGTKLQQWMSQAELPTGLPHGLKDSLQREYNRTLADQLEKEVKILAKNKAIELARQILEEKLDVEVATHEVELLECGRDYNER